MDLVVLAEGSPSQNRRVGADAGPTTNPGRPVDYDVGPYGHIGSNVCFAVDDGSGVNGQLFILIRTGQ